MLHLFNEKGSSVILTMIRGIFTVGVGSTLRTIAEGPHEKAPNKKVLLGAFGYCLLTDTGLPEWIYIGG
jgi:hypothetical protein